MKKILSLLLCFAMAAGLLGGCTRKQTTHIPTGNGLTWEDETSPAGPTTGEEEPQELTMAYYPDRSMNPYLCTDFTNRALFSLIYQGLFAVDRDYNVSPILCQRYTVSEDMKNYTFYLAPDAAFSDGDRVTAEDVVASLLAAMAEGYYSGRFSHVESITTTQDGAVLVKMECAYANLPMLLDIPIVKQEQVQENAPLGSGPYIFRTLSGGAALYRHGSWWCDVSLQIRADTITLIEAESPAHIRDQFEFSDVNLVCADPGSDTYADYRCDYELWDCENGIFLYLACNMDSEVFSNQDVRSALPYAIDRDALAEEYYRGFAQSATLPASPLSPYYDAGLAAKYEYRSDTFAQAVAKAGMKGKKIQLLTNSDDTLRLRTARAMGKMLSDAGLEVELLEQSSEDYVESLRNGKYDLYLGQTRLSPNMDLSDFFHEDGKLSFGPLDDAAMYAMCLQALENSGNYYDLHQMILEDGRLCPVLFRSYAVYASRGMLEALSPARDNVFYYDLGRTLEDASGQSQPDVTDPPEADTTMTTALEITDPQETTAPETSESETIGQ